jgi:hypothetical protein
MERSALMSFTLISVGFENAELYEIENEKSSAFFKAQRKIFSGKLSNFPEKIFKKIKKLVVATDGLGYARAVDVIGVALTGNCPEAFQFIENLQKSKDGCRYLVGK